LNTAVRRRFFVSLPDDAGPGINPVRTAETAWAGPGHREAGRLGGAGWEAEVEVIGADVVPTPTPLPSSPF
jgi:hypothetical protein